MPANENSEPRWFPVVLVGLVGATAGFTIGWLARGQAGTEPGDQRTGAERQSISALIQAVERRLEPQRGTREYDHLRKPLQRHRDLLAAGKPLVANCGSLRQNSCAVLTAIPKSRWPELLGTAYEFALEMHTKKGVRDVDNWWCKHVFEAVYNLSDDVGLSAKAHSQWQQIATGDYAQALERYEREKTREPEPGWRKIGRLEIPYLESIGTWHYAEMCGEP